MADSIQDILDNIQKLQDSEKSLMAQLDLATSKTNFNPDDPNILIIIENINNVSDSRQALFDQISRKATLLQTSVANSRVDLVAQLTLLKNVESQLNDTKAAISQLQNRNDTKMRLVQINTYYGQRYETQSNLMKKIILVCVPLLIVFILKKKSLLPETISNYLVGIIIAVGAILIIRDVWDIFTRSNMNFDEYDWAYEDPNKQAPSIWQYNKENLKFTNPMKNLMVNLGVCVGDTCCGDGLSFDKNKQKCVVPAGIRTTTVAPRATAQRQGFETRTKKLSATYVADIDDAINGDAYVPFSETSPYATI